MEDPSRQWMPPPVTSPAPLPAQRPLGALRKRGGALGGLAAIGLWILAKAKYLLIILKFGVVKTMLTLFLSMGLYALAYGPLFAVALVVMILIHEMGHVVEIRRQGMKATAPIFIPFMGAAIFQRSHPQDAYHQALIGIAGPIAGTLGAIVAAVLYLATGWTPLLLAAYLGFWINLFNLIPAGMLDGGWVLGAVSKWFQVAGLAFILLAAIAFHFFSPLLILIALFGLPMLYSRFRHGESAYYTQVTTWQRIGLFGAWLGLVLLLAWGSVWAQSGLGQP